MRLKTAILGGALAALLITPAPASAEWIFTPFLGSTFGSDVPELEEDLDDDVGEKLSFGGSLAYIGDHALGFELDFGYTPEFFELAETDFDFDSNVTTLMANVTVGAPLNAMPNVRPYASGGAGLIRSRVNDVDDFFDVTNNDFGFNVGGGLTGFFTDNVGIRGDIRYFRALVDDETDGDFDLAVGDFDFWRGTVGVAFRF